MLNWWQDLTFLHWRYSADVVQRLLPEGLEVETFDGSAWVGLIPFRMRVAVPRTGGAAVPWLFRFPETNVRTYARAPDGSTGVWFLSLDAARLPAVLVGRTAYGLPYQWSRMRVTREGGTMRYGCLRRWPDVRGAASAVAVEIGDRYAPAELDDLDHYLTARWTLYSRTRRGGLQAARACHEPWPLYRARLRHLRDDLIPAGGLPRPEYEPIVHFSTSVEVRIAWPHVRWE
jgi:uncharacterized protein YqjF (DUF2071 family)